jgi:hypothetical protein
VKIAAKGEALMGGQEAKTALNSDFGVELYSVMMAGFPGMPPRTVAEDKLLAVRAGMKREEVLSLLGQPLSVSAIQGLDTPRETWTYQVAFGKQFTLKLDGGVVTTPPTLIRRRRSRPPRMPDFQLRVLHLSQPPFVMVIHWKYGVLDG